MASTVLAVNAGSSSLKFGLYEDGDGDAALLLRGVLDLGDAPKLTAKRGDGSPVDAGEWTATGDKGEHFSALLDWIENQAGGDRLAAVGHRIVHGGSRFSAPVRLTDEVIEALEALTPLAPLHQPGSLAPIRALRAARPELAQVGCFDTAFHRTMAPTVRRIALPRRYEDEGVVRYGFHGLSYEYIAGELRANEPDIAGKRIVVAHLGNGASLCALRDGQSADTTMGFSALDGLVMGTRPGGIDAGALLYLLMEKGLSPDEVQTLLYKQSGLLGVSGISADMRTLEENGSEAAREALELFAFRAAREIAAMASTLAGLDALVFTAGIGEHSASIRAAISERLGWLGVRLDAAANAANAPVISAADSAVEVRVIPTNEEIVVARHTLAVTGAGG